MRNYLEIGIILCQRLPSTTRWIFDYCMAIDAVDITTAHDSSLVGKLINLQCLDVDDRGKRQLLAV